MPGTARVALAATAALLTTTPAIAGDQHEFGVSVGPTGVVVSQWVPTASSDNSLGYQLTPECSFTAMLTPNNRLQVAFGGTATSSGPQIPQLTYVRCTVLNFDAQADVTEFANGGPVAYTAKTTSPWRVSPITVCVEAFAVFGPTPVTIISVPTACSQIIA